MKDNNRNKAILIRFTDAEYRKLKQDADNFCSISHYIRSAIKEFSNVIIAMRLKMLETLVDYYKQYESILYRDGANLHQYSTSSLLFKE